MPNFDSRSWERALELQLPSLGVAEMTPVILGVKAGGCLGVRAMLNLSASVSSLGRGGQRGGVGDRAQGPVSSRIMDSLKVRAGRQSSLWSDGETEAQRGNQVGIRAQVPVGTIEERPLVWDWPRLDGGLGLRWEIWQVLVEPLNLMGLEAFSPGRLQLRGGWIQLPLSHCATLSPAQDFRHVAPVERAIEAWDSTTQHSLH